MSILGTKAGLISDLNLLLQLVIIIIFFTGFFYTKRKLRYDMHGKIMGVAVFPNLLSLIFVMVPGSARTLKEHKACEDNLIFNFNN